MNDDDGAALPQIPRCDDGDDDGRGGGGGSGRDACFTATLTLLNVAGLNAYPFVMQPSPSSATKVEKPAATSSSSYDDFRHLVPENGKVFVAGAEVNGYRDDTSSVRSVLGRAAAAAAASTSRYNGAGDAVFAANAGTDRQVGHFDAMCLAFGGGAGDYGQRGDDGKQESPDDHNDPFACVSHIDRLNGMIRDAWGSGSSAAASSGSLVGGCPLVASVTTATEPVLVSSRDDETGDCRTVSAAVVGAVLTAAEASSSSGSISSSCDGRSDRRSSCNSSPSFHLVHAGEHSALDGSQFRIERMVGNAITHVVPVSSPSSGGRDLGAGDGGDGTSSSGAGFDRSSPWGGDVAGGGFSHSCGALSASEWCRQVVSSTSLHEKLAMQRGLGVGVLERTQQKAAATTRRRMARGVMRCRPAHACFEVTEVLETGGGLLVSSSSAGASTVAATSGGGGDGVHAGDITTATGAPGATDHECCEEHDNIGSSSSSSCEAARFPPPSSACVPTPATPVASGPREGDLCDFRAIGGTLAAMQAEQDAYTWLRASRLSALLQQRPSSNEAVGVTGLGRGSGSSPTTESSGSSGGGGGGGNSSRIQGCFVASAGSRVVQGLEGEGCEECVRVASRNSGGSCPTVGLVSDLQLISVDNEVLVNSSSCSAASSNGGSSGGGCGLAGVYVCGG